MDTVRDPASPLGLDASRAALHRIFERGAPPIDDTQAILVLSAGQYQLIYRRDGGVYEKFLTPAAVAAAFSGRPHDSGWLPPNVVRVGEGSHGPFIVYWVPPGTHRFPLIPPQRQTVEWITAPLPGLVLAGVGTRYWLWAVRGRTFDPQAPAFYPPVPNIYHGQGICFGSNQVPAAGPATVKQIWELFCTSPFNTSEVADRSQAEPRDVRYQLLRLAAAAETVYPLGDLVPLDSQQDTPVGKRIEKVMNP